MEPQYGSGLERITGAIFYLLNLLYVTPTPPKKQLSLDERNNQIRSRYSAGETLMMLADAFGISYQRVAQIIHGKHH